MGVSGSGKTTIGELLARRLGIPFIDADDYHPQSNKEKMMKGFALTDEDRWPWLQELSRILMHNEYNGVVMACSALKEAYREILQGTLQSPIHWVLLEGAKDLIQQRMKKRSDHFMPINLLESQFQTLERPAYALAISVDQTPEEIIQIIIKKSNGEA